ncbi:adhesion G protein-coupled receptor E3 [Suncus etruscus]|uniref:adhesion G protein-coupled receptor E3 n=1 Tax=Suncus etruscus TaxID=109475 RepID=UPI00211075B6|nr:adhesion G protein-coupled receptor E3 [Suncus etruscus]
MLAEGDLSRDSGYLNECEPPLSTDCGPHAQCHNVPGTFLCACDPGFELHTGKTEFNNTQENSCQRTSQGGNELRELVEDAAAQLSGPLWEGADQAQVSAEASRFLQSVEQRALNISLRAPEKVQRIQNSSVAAETRVVRHCPSGGDPISLQAHRDTMEIDCRDVHPENGSALACCHSCSHKPRAGGPALAPGPDAAAQELSVTGRSDQFWETAKGRPGAVAFISYESLSSILNTSFFGAEPGQTGLVVGSHIVSVAVSRGIGVTLSRPVTLTYQRVQTAVSSLTICVYWDGSAGGSRWSTEGCELLQVNWSHVTCSVQHLSSFAVLMAFKQQEEDPALTIITYVGLSLSLLCLLLAVLTFLLCRTIQNTSTTIHLHLCLCLFLAHLLFLTAIDRTDLQVLCAVTAGALHYLYLAAFTWMLLEGLHLFLTTRNLSVANYSQRAVSAWWLFPAGYGIPAIIVASSAAAAPHFYGTPERCWLKVTQGFIWVFLGPACAIGCVNFLIFIVVLCILRKKLSSLNSEVSTIRNIRMLTLKATAQLFILGCTWLLGLLQFGPAARVMAYVFTITTSLQGIFLFLVYCVLNQRVQRWAWECIKPKSEPKDITLSSRFGTDSKPDESK